MASSALRRDPLDEITRRLDAVGERAPGPAMTLGISWYYMRLVLMTGIGWGMDSMETFVFVYCSKAIGASIPMSLDESTFLGGAVFIGSFIGSFAFGTLADWYGRRPMFMVTLLIFMVGLGLCAVSHSFAMIVTFRIIGGIGLGGELPVASTLVQELAPKRTRGKIIVLLESFWAVGVMVAIWLAFGVQPRIGWRNTFGLCMIPVVYAAAIRVCIPESPKWLARHGRYEEAVAIVEQIERSHGLIPPEPDQMHTPVNQDHAQLELAKRTVSRVSQEGNEQVRMLEDKSQTAPSSSSYAQPSQSMSLLFRQPFLTRSVVLWTLWFVISMSYYAIYVYLPILIGKTGYNINGSWKSLLLITFFQLPGYLTASVLVEIWSRKITLVVFLVGSFASALLLGYVPGDKTSVLTAGSLLSFFMLGAWGCVYAYTPENYPTSVRGMGSAYPAGFSRIGAFIGPYLVPYMNDTWKLSLHTIMWIFGGALVLVAGIVFMFGFEPKGKDIEEVGYVEVVNLEGVAVQQAHYAPMLATPVLESSRLSNN